MLGNRDGFFYAINDSTSAAPGTLKWKYNVGSPIVESAAYASGVVYFAATDNITLRDLSYAFGSTTTITPTTVSRAFFGGLTSPEIALHLNESVGTVKSRLRLGLEKLRDLANALVVILERWDERGLGE